MLRNYLRYSYDVIVASILSTFVLTDIAYILIKCRVGGLSCYWRLEYQKFRRLKIFLSPHCFDDNIFLPLWHLLLYFRHYLSVSKDFYSFHSLTVWDNNVRKTSSLTKYLSKYVLRKYLNSSIFCNAYLINEF